MSTLKRKEKTLWRIKMAHIFVALFFIFGVFSFYVANVYSYPGEDNLGPMTCTDSIDNDSDGYTDSSDSQCTDPPSTPDLLSGSDSGSSNTDNITNVSYPEISVACQSGLYVRLYLGGVQIGVDTLCSGGSAGFSLFSIPQSLFEGSNNFTATHINNGETEHSGILTVTLDTSPPDAPGTPNMTAGTDSGSSSIDDLTSDTSPDFTISCEEGATVELRDSSNNTLGTGTCSGGTVTITPSPAFADGNAGYSLSSRQTDVAGAGTADSPDSLAIVIDTIAPTTSGAPNMTPGTDSGTSSTDDYTSDATPTFTGACTDGTTVQLYDDGVSSGSSITCSSSAFSLTTGTLAEGSNSITFKETDAAGNTSTASTALVVIIDTTAPAAPGTPDLSSDSGSSSTDNITSDTTPEFTMSCESSASVSLIDGADDTTVLGTGSCTASLVGIVSSSISGSKTVKAKQTDGAGNVSSLSSGLSITIDTTAPTTSGAPDMTSGTDLGSSSTDDITSDTTPTFTGVCTDGNTVQLFDDGSSSGSSSTCASSVFSLTTGTLATGSNSITFKETDTAGNISSASSALVVTIDATSPTISEVTPISTGTDTTPDYTFTTDEVGTISYGGSCSSVTTSATSGSNTITLDALAVGTYADCTVIVTDSASNASNTLTLTSFTISAPASSSNLSGSVSNTTRVAQRNNDTPTLPACLGGALFNIYTGRACQTTEPTTPGCFTGFNFSIITGEACSKTTETPSTPTPNTPPTPINLNKYIFTKDIPFGATFNDDAKQLQIFLNTHGFTIASTGPGSLGKETRYFGPATRTALIKFQKANNISPAIGYFGPKTRALVNSL